MPAPLLSTSTPKLPETILTQVRRDGVVCVVCCVVCGVFSPPPLVFIRGSHQPLAREMSQTAIGDRPHLATCHLRGGGARGPLPLGRRDLFGRPTMGWACLAQFSVRWLLGGPPCDIHVQGPILRWFGSSGRPVDPCERV